MKKIFLILLIAIGVIACDKTEPAVFNGGQTLVYFPNSTANLDVIIDDVGTVNVAINATSLSNEDRVITLEIIEESTSVDLDNVDIPSLNVTIPANDYFGNFVVNGIDNSVETTPELLTMRIVDASGALINDAPIEISVRQICPIEEGFFTGPYAMVQVTPDHPDNGGRSFNDQILDIELGEGSTERSFSAIWLEYLGIGQPASTVPFNLSCNEVVVTSDAIATGLACSGEPGILLGSAGPTGSYDGADDTNFNLILSEYVEGGCGVAAPLVTEFNFTKQ